MIEDKSLMMSDAQEIRNNGDTDSAEVLDITLAGDFQKVLYWIVRVNETFETSTAGTLAASLQTADDSNFEELPGMNLPATVADSLTAGTVLLMLPLPYDLKRFLKTVFTVAPAESGAFTTGKIDSFIGMQPDFY